MDQSTKQPNDYLMVLRALSAIAVVFCHLPFQANKFLLLPESEWLNGFFDPFGYIPVLIFFSLSGYLVSLGFITHRHDAYSIKGISRYYRSRILRIIPLYYFSILFCTLIFWSAAEENAWRVIKLFFFVENYKPAAGIVFNHVYWTMPVEMLYFFFAPILFIAIHWLANRSGDVTCLFLIIIISVLIAHNCFSGLEKTTEGVLVSRREWSQRARFDFLYNLSAFMLGSVSALIATNNKYKPFFERYRLVLKAMILLVCIGIIIYCSTVGLDEMAVGVLGYFTAYALIPCMGLVVLGIAVINNTQAASIAPKNKILQVLEYLGVLSYGIYLFHMPIYAVGQNIISDIGLTISNECLTLLVLISTIAFSQVTYRYVEQPFLRRR